MPTDTLAVDFGTSNSAAAILSDGEVRRIPIEAGADTLPTAVFFAPKGPMLIGQTAAEALIDGEEGRYMRALKSALGLPLLQEKRLLGGKRRSIAEVIAAFLAELKSRAEAASGQRFRRALSGRPVRFHTNDPEKDAQAEADLAWCYRAAGFEAAAFLPEPAAAALATHRLGAKTARAEALGLVVDIGGGTSDFSVFRSAGDRAEILANHGLRLGGVTFDRSVSIRHAMPLLGLGGQLRREMGDGLLPVPPAFFNELASWAKIPFLYTPETRRMAAEMARDAVEPEKLRRLAAVLEQQLGHELAFAVERGKIAANEGAATARAGVIDMGFIEPGLGAAVTPESLDAALFENRATLRAAAAETLRLAGVSAAAVDRIVLVGGSSLMRFVPEEMQTLCPGAALQRSEAFTAVVDGLALGSRG